MTARARIAIAGVAVAPGLAVGSGGLYDYAWSHPMVMLLGQFAALAALAFSRGSPWTLPPAWAGFWLVTGFTVRPLLGRAADLLDGAAAATLAAVAAVALAAAVARGSAKHHECKQ